ncbi:hypothetical protein C4571_02530 [Candidatus Parcubacteria bacterium]|nr:MAG: hypothetical protein C4571_02530 [Candidatus Parcubacteria bacterium]
MAIIVEEGKNKVNIGAILTWLVVILVLGLVAYYVFFQRPEFIELIPPSGLRDTTRLSKINLNSEEVLNNPQFQLLKQYISVPRSGNAGRENPFLSF